ncbi:MAG TPA: hypothetical protein DDW82_04405 [Acholeplasmataceae bacterium]|nr:hypothetical protein [Acholeplasmataceae bacterium]
MKLDKMAEKLGFQLKSGVFSRTYNGYEVSLVLYRMQGQYVKLPMLLFVFSQALDKEVFKQLSKGNVFRGFVKESVALKDNAILCSAGFRDKEALDEFLEKKTQIFKELNLGQLDYCPYCGQKETDSLRIIKGAVVHVHEACVNNFVEKVTTHLNTVGSSKENLVKSIIYSVIGGLIGLIPSIIVMMIFSFYSAWLFLLIPYAAFYGFKKGGAQKGSYVMIVITVISLILAPGFMFYVYYDLSLYLEVSFGMMLNSADIYAAFVKDMIMAVIFTLISVWASWKSIYKQTHGQIKRDIQDLQG